MSKKRTKNEFRQVKGFGYRPPHSHRERLQEQKTLTFNKESLKNFTEGLLVLEELTDTSIEDYINEYFK